VLTRGWDLTLEPDQTARVVMELARYSLSETQPRYRTGAFRSIASGVMDGREGRCPTPLNVAELAVEMLDPKPGEWRRSWFCFDQTRQVGRRGRYLCGHRLLSGRARLHFLAFVAEIPPRRRNKPEPGLGISLLSSCTALCV
jgi:hypothetical protein